MLQVGDKVHHLVLQYLAVVQHGWHTRHCLHANLQRGVHMCYVHVYLRMCILRMCLHLHILTLPVWLAVRCRFHEELSVYSMRFTLKSKLKIYALA